MDPGADQTRLWLRVAEIWMGVALGEIPSRDGLGELLDGIEAHLGTSCEVIDDRSGASTASAGASRAIGSSRSSYPLRDPLGQHAGTLVFHGEPPVLVGDRIGRVVETLVAGSLAHAAGRVFAHETRNKLASLLANIELVEHMLADARPEAPLLAGAERAERAIVLEAITMAASAARLLSKLIRAASEP